MLLFIVVVVIFIVIVGVFIVVGVIVVSGVTEKLIKIRFSANHHEREERDLR
jgi:Tfp pilus assembly protein PilX